MRLGEDAGDLSLEQRPALRRRDPEPAALDHPAPVAKRGQGRVALRCACEQVACSTGPSG